LGVGGVDRRGRTGLSVVKCKSVLFVSFCDILFICQILNIRGPLPILNGLPSWSNVHFRPVTNSERSHADKKTAHKKAVRWVSCFQVPGLEIEHYGRWVHVVHITWYKHMEFYLNSVLQEHV
jgi:hypothetical protein